MSSNYSPMEGEDSEEDEIVVVSLLSDESDEERVRVKRKRVQRNRAGESTFKRKKMRLRKPAVEHKSVTQTSSHQTTQDAGITLKVEPPGDIAKSSVMNIPATTKSGSIIASPGSYSNQEIEHLSGPRKVKTESNSTSVDDNAVPEFAGYDTTMKSTIATSLTCVNSVQSCLQKELYPNEVRDHQSELTKPASNDDKDDSDAILGGTVSQSTDVKCAANAPKNTICTQPANTSDDAGVATNVSDMRTVELKCKKNTDIENNAIETCNSTRRCRANANDDSKKVVKSAVNLLQKITELDDEDISEAETEMLEDDEVDTYNVSHGGGSGDDGAASETETVHSNDTAPAPTNEVQHFFDFVPLKSKPKVKTTSFATLKPLTFHSHTKTFSSVEKENETCVKVISKTNTVVPTKPSVGSNGLRRNRKTIGSPSIKNGKSITTRRCIKILDDVPVAKKQQKSQYTMVVTKKLETSSTKDFDDVPLSCLVEVLFKETEDKPQAKYLSYGDDKKVEEPKRSDVEAPRIVSKSRYGGAGLSSIAAQNTPSSSNGQPSKVKDNIPANFNYRREPQ
ncbi:hypothetical protein PsorP6_005189 [Peronosclerospora sorghi]|uniref:Uncharacterized protein n=1 Tax=Peronosclerospora sorghi TaxID=230839 RepID=A0ACC0W492_9STRA|nr:hypothetical protein PsorP6_005189 [Peronosclerospora sorghi]